jgi:hypothetical protein
MVLPYCDPLWIVTVTVVLVALCAVSVIVMKLFPHDEKVEGLTVSAEGLLTTRVIGLL